LVRFLFEEMNRQGKTGTGIAAEIGIAKSMFSHWAPGRSDPKLKDLEAWANVLGLDLKLVKRE